MTGGIFSLNIFFLLSHLFFFKYTRGCHMVVDSRTEAPKKMRKKLKEIFEEWKGLYKILITGTMDVENSNFFCFCVKICC